MSKSRKLFRVEWLDPQMHGSPAPEKQVAFKLAFNTTEILEEFIGDEKIDISEATRPEQEAYVAGYNDGQDTANLSFRLNALNQDDLD
jgi:hypothetical protein